MCEYDELKVEGGGVLKLDGFGRIQYENINEVTFAIDIYCVRECAQEIIPNVWASALYDQ